jgi:hypothetical protein
LSQENTYFLLRNQFLELFADIYPSLRRPSLDYVQALVHIISLAEVTPEWGEATVIDFIRLDLLQIVIDAGGNFDNGPIECLSSWLKRQEAYENEI